MSATASIIASCDALVAYLNSIQMPPVPPITVPPTPAAVNPFAPFTFTAYRDYAPVFELSDPSLSNLHVVVCPRDKDTSKMEGRTSWLQDDGIDILILIKPANFDPSGPVAARLAILDPLMLLVEQIANAVAFEDFGGYGWIRTQNNPIYAPDGPMGLRQSKLFTSVLHLTLRGRGYKT